MPLILGTNSIKDTGYDVANSCRFDDGDSAYMTKTPDSAGNRDRWTFSTWTKRGNLSGEYQTIISASGGSADDTDYFYFNADNTLHVHLVASGSAYGTLYTNRKFRDISAWYNIILVYDSGNGTAGDRLIMYINGVRETSFSAATYPSQNADSVMTLGSGGIDVGRDGSSSGSGYLDGYLAETVLIDGLALDATSFGEFDDSGIWKPIDVSGLTFGTNGFYLDFEASDNLGNDANGGTDLTEVNLAATDQSTDTCTNNFCTLNPLNEQNITGHDFSEGNCVISVASGERASSFGTIGMTNGKWYMEMKLTNASGHDFLGIAGKGNGGATDQLGWANYQWSYYSATGKYAHDAGEISFSGGNTTWGVNDTIGLAIDLDSGTKTLKWHKNGTYQSDVTLNQNAEDTDWGAWFFAAGSGSGSNDSVYSMNFGNPAHTISSSNTDGNGYGNFEYAVPSGYYSLCTKNLAEYG
jgi:hypothetical protein